MSDITDNAETATSYEKNGWVGFVEEYPGMPMGLFQIRAKKGSLVLLGTKLSADQIDKFDPDEYWRTGVAIPTTKNGRALKENRRA